jgi:predicted glycogen debranching enzyme
MVDPRRAVRDESPSPEAPREWVVANGLGGYASATVTGAITRRYHGFLIAAQPAPLGRMVVLSDLEVDVELADGRVVNLRENGRFLDFTLNMGLPSWRYELDGVVIEKSIVVPSRQNIVHCTFRSLGDGQPVRLRLRPLINFRPLEAPVADALSSGYSYTLSIQGHRYEVSAGPDLPILRLAVEGAEGPTFTADGGSRRERFYDIEAQRGYDSRGWLWSPGYLAQGSPDEHTAARRFLDGFEPHLAEAGIGSISEVFDAEPPFTPRGCIAQAWSVAEVLRCSMKTALDQE